MFNRLDAEPAYLAWLSDHPCGFVVNTDRPKPRSFGTTLHRANCWTIGPRASGGGRLTGRSYQKVCAKSRSKLERWSEDHVGQLPKECGMCLGSQRSSPSDASSDRAAETRTPARTGSGKVSQVQTDWEVQGDTSGVTALATFALSNEPKGPQIEFVGALQAALRTYFKQSPEPALHGSFEGPAWAGSDLENLLLFNVRAGTFSAAELDSIHLRRPNSPTVPLPSRFTNRYQYRISKAPPPATGRQSPSLAIADFELPQRVTWGCAEVWWAALGRPIATSGESTSGPLGVTVRLEGPRRVNLAAKVKPLLDGFLCALHYCESEPGQSTVGRIAAAVGGSAGRITELLRARDSAPLGPTRLVWPRGTGLQWAPADDRLTHIDISWAEAPRWRMNATCYAVPKN